MIVRKLGKAFGKIDKKYSRNECCLKRSTCSEITAGEWPTSVLSHTEMLICLTSVTFLEGQQEESGF